MVVTVQEPQNGRSLLQCHRRMKRLKATLNGWSQFSVALSLITFQSQIVWPMVKKYFILKYFAMGLEVQVGHVAQ